MSDSKHLLIRAARGEKVERPPVWAMRQAGRWDPEFNRLRGDLTFFEFSENAELAAKASLLPRRFGVDAIILFYDITTLPVAMGLPFTLQPGRGPVPDHPIRTMSDVERLDAMPPADSFQHIIDLLHRVESELQGDLPIIVFAGAPFTVASYCIGTGKDLDATRRFAAEQSKAWDALLQRLQVATVHFLITLVDHGANIYQLFDSWAGMLDQTEYETWAQPFHSAILAGEQRVPRIIFVKECPYLDRMAATGADVVSLGTRHDLREARRKYPDLAFQGNVDSEIMQNGNVAEVEAATIACKEAGGGQRHIINLNHGMNRASPVANFEAYIRAARSS